ncbi:hypothetical protein H744_2c2230 [Photobacterium gaetbulicola Gung47]|uniref:Uncharacterized protein n=1 Tax=Photobacterium gaetbulicola Gung47 TaxID=658445 RepID=A0A0C5WP26_9GAMM|nr:hypothetical protein H744_2c2230 [Photobacterium gaetbulicola Gung47]
MYFLLAGTFHSTASHSEQKEADTLNTKSVYPNSLGTPVVFCAADQKFKHDLPGMFAILAETIQHVS